MGGRVRSSGVRHAGGGLAAGGCGGGWGGRCGGRVGRGWGGGGLGVVVHQGVSTFWESVPWFYLHDLGDGGAAKAGFELSDHLVELFALLEPAGVVLEEAGLAGVFGGEAAEFEFEFGDEAGEFGVFDEGLDDEPESISVAGGFAEGVGAFPELVVFGDGSESELSDEVCSGAGMSEGALEELACEEGHGFSADEWGF